MFDGIIISIVVIWITVGCKSQYAEVSILDNPVCAPPCWQNIAPGTTTRQEFLDLIENYEYVEQDSVHDYSAPWQGFNDLVRGRLRFDSDTVTHFDAFLLDDKIADLSFHGDWSITLDQAINTLGKPTSIVIISHGNDVFVELLNPAKGIAFGYSTINRPSSWQVNIQPNIRISSIDFFAPEAYQQILDSGLFSYGLLNGDDTLRNISAWKGFGSIEELYPSKIP